MSESYDKRPGIKLSPENQLLIASLKKTDPILAQFSSAKLANILIADGVKVQLLRRKGSGK